MSFPFWCRHSENGVKTFGCSSSTSSSDLQNRWRNVFGRSRNARSICEQYAWPGNIRELQNIVERSVILCSGGTFSIDEVYLSSQAPGRVDASGPLTQTLLDQEKGIIEGALLQSKGKVAGARGAAAKLRIPPSTLQSKIKQLKIDKERFNRSDGRRNQHRQSDSVVGPLETRSGS